MDGWMSGQDEEGMSTDHDNAVEGNALPDFYHKVALDAHQLDGML